MKHLGEFAGRLRLGWSLSRAFQRLFRGLFWLGSEGIQEHSRGRQRVGLTGGLCSRFLAFFCHPDLTLIAT